METDEVGEGCRLFPGMKTLSSMSAWLTILALGSCAPHRDERSVMNMLQAPAFFIATGNGEGPTDDVRAIGHADWEKTQPVSADMHLRIGSVTKLFIGNLVLILRDEGKLDVNAPVSRYVSGVPDGDRITLLQLANHTSGLPEAIRNPEFQKAIVADPSRVWTAPEILQHAFAQPVLFAPGTSWRYSNTNTILLALAAEKATGKSCGELLQEKLFTPLGMEHTGFPDKGQLPHPHPRGYRHCRPGNPIGYGKTLREVSEFNASWAHAAGNLSSTAGDLQKATRALCLGTLLSEESRRLLHHWQDTGENGYRYGFCIESWDGFIGHRGDVPGFQAVIAVEEKSGRAFAVMANLSNTADGKGPATELLGWLVK